MLPKVRLAVAPLATTVLIAFGLLILLWVVSQTIWIWVVVLVAFILAAAMGPIVNAIHRPEIFRAGWHIPRQLAVFLVYLALGVTIGFGAWILGNLVVKEVNGFADAFPAGGLASLGIAQSLAATFNLPPDAVPTRADVAADLRQIGAALVSAVAGAIPSFVTFIVRFFIVLTLAAFLVIEATPTLNFWVSLFPPASQAEARRITLRMGETMGFWLIGMGAQMTIIGLLSGLAAALLGLPGPVFFGIAAAFLELAPSLGQILMVIPAVFFGLMQSRLVAVEAAILYLVIAQAEAVVLAPLMAHRTAKLSPILTVIAIPVGLTLYGSLGAILAVPLTAAVQIFIQEVVLPWLHRAEAAPAEPVERPADDHEQRAA
jgi:predicted PurR-regulated permease PerM